MWFWIALWAFFLVVFLVAKVAARDQEAIHPMDPQQGYDVNHRGVADSGPGGDLAAGWTGGGWGDGGGGGE